MADTVITSFEIRLLLCSLDGAEAANPCPDLPAAASCDDQVDALHEPVRSLITSVERGDIRGALCSPLVTAALWRPHDASRNSFGNCVSEFYSAVRAHIESFLHCTHGANESSKRLDALLLMGVGVAVLMAFWQVNVTGPRCIFPACRSLIMADDKEIIDDNEWNQWALKQLMVDGCDLSGLCTVPQYLILAKIILVDTFDAAQNDPSLKKVLPTSFGWWARRALFANQSILEERSSSLYASLTALKFEGFQADWGKDLDSKYILALRSAMHLEYGLIESAYGHVDQARSFIEEARRMSGIELSLTGALGYRTVHQVDAKAQMVLVATSGSQTTNEIPREREQFSSADMREDTDIGQSMEEDILMFPRLVTSNVDGPDLSRRKLSSFEQVVVLAQCLLVKKNNPDDELRGWQMAPYIEAVDFQEQSPFLTKRYCQLLRIHWESTRNRTKQRALLMHEQLVADIQGTPSSSVQERMCYAFCLQFPTLSVLRKDLAEIMVSCGLVGEAMRIFEELELWNSLIDCYCLLGKKASAVDLIKKRLNEQPEDPRLWCALGDVSLKDECYEKAWEVSKHHFGRAKRSLGRSAYNKGDYVLSIQHWEAALALNSLQPDGWFALGSAALKARELDKALEAFTRTVQLEPGHGEAWNNIAAVHMTRKRSKEAFVAFKEALKFKRTSWQMWENYAWVAVDVRNFRQAVEAMTMVLDLSQGKHAMVECLDKVMEEVEGQHKKPDGQGNMDATGGPESGLDEFEKGPISGEEIVSPALSSDGIIEMEPHATERDWLIKVVGHLLARVVQFDPNSATWGLLARWHKVRGDLEMCSEALLKKVRSLQGTGWQNNRNQFEELCQSALQLSDVYMNLAQESRSKKNLYSVQMLLRNLIKQGEVFSHAEIYSALVTGLEKVQQAFQNLQ